MTSTTGIEEREAIVVTNGLSGAQRRYLLALGASDGPYEPRHGVTANWALRHGYACTIVRLADGRELNWHEVSLNEVVDILGQRLTQAGQAVHDALSAPLDEGC